MDLTEVVPVEVESPALNRLVREPQAGEGDGEFHLVSGVSDLPGRFEHQIEILVFAILRRPEGIVGDAIRIDIDNVRPGRIAVRVEEEPNVVIREDAFPLAQRGANSSRSGVAYRGQVEVVVIVGHKRLGANWRAHLFAGRVLREAGGGLGFLPTLIAQIAVDLNRAGRTADMQCRKVCGNEFRIGRIGR